MLNKNPKKNNLEDVKEKAREMRIRMVRMVECARSGHLAPAMSCADIVAVLFFNIMNFSPENFKDGDRDRFVLSGGHKALALYTALSLKGFASMMASLTVFNKCFPSFSSMLESR